MGKEWSVGKIKKIELYSYILIAITDILYLHNILSKNLPG